MEVDRKRLDTTPTIGNYSAVSIEQARERAATLKSRAKNAPTGRVSALPFSTVRDLAQLYIVHLQSLAPIKPSTKDFTAYLRKLPGWFLDLGFTAVTQLEVHQLITDYRQHLLVNAKDDTRVRSLNAVGKLLQAVKT